MHPDIQAILDAHLAKRKQVHDRQAEIRDMLFETETELIRDAVGRNEVDEDQLAAAMLDMLHESHRIDVELFEGALQIAQAVRDAETGAEPS